jgi:hypothetical protein
MLTMYRGAVLEKIFDFITDPCEGRRLQPRVDSKSQQEFGSGNKCLR